MPVSFIGLAIVLVSSDGHTLTYDQALNVGINSQPTAGFNIDPTTGQITISAAETGGIQDNQYNVGADRAFSGNILSSDGSFVEFDWLLDAVDGSSQNLAPTVADGVASGLAGDLFNFTFAASDPDPGDMVTLDGSLFGILGIPAHLPMYDSLTGAFSWDSTGSAPGTYVFQARGSDLGGLTDIGSYSVTLLEPPENSGVPEPASLAVWSCLIGVMGGAGYRRKRKS